MFGRRGLRTGRLLGTVAVVILAIVGVTSPGLSAQGPYTAQIQQELRSFLTQVHSWTSTQSFTNIIVSGSCSGCGGGSGDLTAKYILQQSDGLLPNAQALGNLTTGLVINTITTGVLSTYTGATCTNQFVRSLSAIGAATCATVVLGTDTTGSITVPLGGTGQASYTKGDLLAASGSTTLAKVGVGTDGQVLQAASGQAAGVQWATVTGLGTVTNTGGALTASALVVGNGGADVKVLASLGTTTTVLHGNAAGLPSYSAVVLTSDVQGILPTAAGGTGIAYFTAAGPTVARTYTFPDASANVLTDNTLITGAQGGTGNGFFAVTGPTTSLKTFTFPNASATVLTSNAAVTVAQGGTGLASGTSGGVLGYTASGTLASSGALTAHGVVIGGGAGATPTSTAAGSSGQVLTSNGASADPTFQAAGGVTLYTPTLANISNSTTETSVCQFTVVGGAMADGGVIDLTLLQQELDTTAASPTFTYKVYWGGSLVGTWAAHQDNSVTRKYLSRFTFQRAGTTLYVTTPQTIAQGSLSPYTWAAAVQAGTSTANVLSLTSATFASNALVEVRVTLSAASANVTYTALGARAMLIP